MAKEKPEAEEIRIRRTEIMVPTAEGEPTTMIHTTYTVKDLVPGMISMRKEEWSEAKEAELIRKDIEERRKRKPITIRL